VHWSFENSRKVLRVTYHHERLVRSAGDSGLLELAAADLPGVASVSLSGRVTEGSYPALTRVLPFVTLAGERARPVQAVGLGRAPGGRPHCRGYVSPSGCACCGHTRGLSPVHCRCDASDVRHASDRRVPLLGPKGTAKLLRAATGSLDEIPLAALHFHLAQALPRA